MQNDRQHTIGYTGPATLSKQRPSLGGAMWTEIVLGFLIGELGDLI